MSYDVVAESGGAAGGPGDLTSESGARSRWSGRRPVLVLAVGLLVLAATAAIVVRRGGGGNTVKHNATVVPGLELFTLHGRGRASGEPGTIGITAPVDLLVLAPVTLLDARPFTVDDGVEVLGARAIFTGRGISETGRRRIPGYPLAVCSPDQAWPPEGYGPSYPVPALTLVPRETVTLVFYVRASTPGVRSVSGFRIRYRTADGKIHTATSDLAVFEMRHGEPGHCSGESWLQPHPGYPS